MHLEIEIGDDEVELAVAVVVAGIDPHARARACRRWPPRRRRAAPVSAKRQCPVL